MKYQNTKIWLKTLAKLRLIYAITGEKMTSILDRLVSDELERVSSNADSKSIQDRIKSN